ncbi:MAG: outer membrane beta-barrel protein [Myxococcales bacterium]|nr:MAG: outer membrane beta-barrel protein [Myxococcales bacterium]
MTKFLSLAVMCSLAIPAMAFAQETGAPEAPKQAADDLDKEYEGETPAEPAEPGEPPPKEAEMKMPEPPKMAADDIAAEEPAEGRPFLDGLSWQLLASAFYRISGYTNDGVRAGTYNNLLDPSVPAGYPYVNYHGFGLAFAGGDVMYTGEKFAVRLDLRWGTGAPLLTPIAPVKQAYAAWLPHEKISIDVGFFDTIYGAEVVDEWNNANYSRGALYFLRQPFNHAGLRFGAELGQIVGMTFMVTNGGVYGGTAIDDNEVPALGWQFGLSPDGHNSVRRRGLREGYREVGLFFGGNHAPNGANGNKDYDHFFDVVLSLNFDWFTLLFNGDYHIDGHSTDPANNSNEFDYGHSLALIFDVADQWSIGVRGEHLSGNTNYRNTIGSDIGGLGTATLTIRYKPVEYLVISLEGRGEWAQREVYFSRSATTVIDPVTMEEVLVPNKGHNYAAILGVTAHIGN